MNAIHASGRRLPGRVPAAALVATLALAAATSADVQQRPFGAFSFSHTVTLPGTPEVIYDAMTGDVSGWWDHSFSGKPARYYLEPEAGGGFWEMFDDQGNGVLHANVIYADRGKLLRLDGPFGLGGNAIKLVITYAFEPVGADSTRLEVSGHGAGELEDGWAAGVDRAWKHFIVDQFKTYVESGAYLKTK